MLGLDGGKYLYYSSYKFRSLYLKSRVILGGGYGNFRHLTGTLARTVNHASADRAVA